MSLEHKMTETDFNPLPNMTADPVPPNLSRIKVEAVRNDLALAWITAEILGAIAIAVAPESFGGWRMVPPLCFMAIYLTFAFTRSRFNTERVADSAYFMGFWWTLWALIDLLVLHGQDMKAEKLYTTFGYALVTTAAGMFARLAILQFYRTIDDQEEQAVDLIDEHVTKLIIELERSQKATAELRGIGVKTLEDWHRDFVTASGETLADVKRMAGNFASEGDSLTNSIKAIQQSLTAMNRLFGSLEKRLGVSTDRISTAIESSVESLEKSVLNLLQRLKAVEIPPDLITSKTDGLMESIQKAVNPVAELATKTLADLNKAVGDVAKGVSQLPKNEELHNAALVFAEQLKLVAAACGNLRDEADKATSALSSVTSGASAISTDLAGVQKKVTDLSTAVQLLSKDAQKVNSTVREVVTFVQSELGEAP